MRPRERAGGGFLGGRRSARAQIRTGRKPEDVMITDGRAKGWWPKGGDIWVGVMQFLRACGARPSGGWPSRRCPASRDEAPRTREGGFLGGMRSPRPCGKAGPKPRHDIINGDNRTPGGLVGTILRCKQGLVYGRAEPAPPGRTSPAWMAVRGKVGDDAEGVFSEGRGLRARVARPYASPGMA